MKRKKTYFHKDKDKDFIIESMQKYMKKKPEIDKFFEEIVSPYIKNKDLKILDACCGIGHNLYYLDKISPESTFLGIDETQYLISEAKKICKGKKNIKFELSDIYKIDSKYDKVFDITLNLKTISWLPYYKKILKSLFKVTKKHIFLSSLFYDGDIDFEIKVREYKKEAGKMGFKSFYNVYSYPHFQEFVYELGAKKVQSYDFHMNIDIPKPPLDQMGTYTVKLEDGSRLQISGAVLMLWKIVRIDL